MKKLSTLALSLCMSALMVTPVFAGSISREGQDTFVSAWEDTASSGSSQMVYGFNTAWIDEDYTHGFHPTQTTTAIVQNGNGSFNSSAAPSKWAKIEVRHSGSDVDYIIKY